MKTTVERSERMRIDYISDLHLNFYVEPEGNEKIYIEKTRMFLQKLLPSQIADVLVLAGDLSHFNKQSYETLKFFSEYYKQVFFVFGNHDYYLVSKKQRQKYHNRSIEREEELVRLIENIPNVQLLRNFEVVTYNDVTFAGATSWYPLYQYKDMAYFKQSSNDSVYIQELSLQLLHEREMAMYKKMPEVDVLVTHVPPIILESHRKYGSTSCFLNELKDVKASVCIFGHCHEQKVYEKAGIQFAINAVGYPEERLTANIRMIEVEIK